MVLLKMFNYFFVLPNSIDISDNTVNVYAQTLKKGKWLDDSYIVKAVPEERLDITVIFRVKSVTRDPR